MKYHDNKEIQVGDQVELWPGNRGVVVCSIDAEEYSEAYPREEWEYLGSGILVLSEKAGLIHYTKLEPEVRFLSRGA